MRVRGETVAGFLALLSACAPHPGVLAEDAAATSSSSSSSSSGGGIAPDSCDAWSGDRSDENLRSLNRFALHRAVSVVEGTLGAPVRLRDRWYAPLHVDTVHSGLTFLEGTDSLVDVQEATVGAQPSLLAVSTAHPHRWEFATLPVWSNTLAVVPAAERDRYADALGYRTGPLTHVAVVRIVEQDAYRTRFAVVEALKGTFPTSFSDNWYAEWRLPYPPVDADRRYIAGLQGLGTASDGTWLGSVVDFRQATDEALATVREALAHPVVPYDVEAMRAARDLSMTGYLFHTAPVVVASVVTGTAEECCSNLGGQYVAHRVTSVLQGASSAATYVAGGHGYRGDEACGDAFVSGLAGVVDPGAAGTFSCTTTGGVMPWDATAVSSVLVRLPSSAESLSSVHGWLTASDPVYALTQGASALPSVQLPGRAPWSVPLDAVEALAGAPWLAIFTVEEVNRRDGFHEVVLGTTLSLYEYPGLTRHRLRLAFTCGDARLLQTGARWIGGFVTTGQVSYDPAHPVVLGPSYLVPGALIPASAMSTQLAHELSTFLR